MKLRPLSSLLAVFALSGFTAQAATIFQLGAPGRGWPIDGGADGGGPNVDFYQENGTVQDAPGSAMSTLANQQSDNDYYFAGVYPDPIGIVASDELGAERAYAGADNMMRIHHNLIGVNPTDNITVSFEANNLHVDPATHNDPRWGVEVYVNGNLLMPELVIRPAELNTVFTTPALSASALGVAPGSDNIVELRGISYNGDNGGNWMGLDYYQLDATPIPEPTAPMLLALAASGLAILRRRR